VTQTCVMLVEDDPNIVDLVRSNLLARGYFVVVSSTGLDVASLMDEYDPSIVLLDLMLPGADGFDICRDIRQRSDIGIIIVSARTNEADKVRALNLGADDYLTKPFGVDELLARMMATLRRSRIHEEDPQTTTIEVGELSVDLEAKLVIRAGERVKLTPTEYALLRYFVLHPDVLLSYPPIVAARLTAAFLQSLSAHTSVNRHSVFGRKNDEPTFANAGTLAGNDDVRCRL